jgi:hypothetical protein
LRRGIAATSDSRRFGGGAGTAQKSDSAPES